MEKEVIEMEYMIEMDTVSDGYFVEYFECDTLAEAKEFACREMSWGDGGHADIFNDDGEFVDDVEC